MSYNTRFNGCLKFNKPVVSELKEYINKFSEIRHIKLKTDEIKLCFPNWKQDSFNGNLGEEGMFFINSSTWGTAAMEDYNVPPRNCPSLYCQWIINDYNELEWDGGEGFYEYVDWLKFLIKYFFNPNGYILNGTIYYSGDDTTDNGRVVVTDNNVVVFENNEDEYILIHTYNRYINDIRKFPDESSAFKAMVESVFSVLKNIGMYNTLNDECCKKYGIPLKEALFKESIMGQQVCLLDSAFIGSYIGVSLYGLIDDYDWVIEVIPN